MIVETLAERWWSFALRGVAAILFGVLCFVSPGLSLAALIILYGSYALIDGVFRLVGAFRVRGIEQQWWVLALSGLFGILAGVVTFMWPALTAIALVYIIAAWSIVTGVFEIAAAIRLRKVIEGEWMLILGGVLSIAFGLLLAVYPATGALALLFWIGAYAVVVGVLWIALAFKLKGFAHPSGPRASVREPRFAD